MSKIELLKLDKKCDYTLFKEWCITIYDYILSIDSSFSLTAELFYRALSVADKKKDLNILKEIYQETNLMAREILRDDMILPLNNILREKFNYCIEDEIKKVISIVQKIIRRGKILNSKEFEIVKRREEEIYADDSQQEYAEVLRNLLADYEGNNALHNNDGISGDGS